MKYQNIVSKYQLYCGKRSHLWQIIPSKRTVPYISLLPYEQDFGWMAYNFLNSTIL